MKRKLLVLGAIMICLSIISVGTLTYFTAEERTHNKITMGGIDIAIVETYDDWVQDENDPNLYKINNAEPGQRWEKAVAVKNIGENNVWVRAQISLSITLADGVTKGDARYINLVTDNTKWSYDSNDGLYYYTEILSPGETTENILNLIELDGAMGNEYMNCTIEIVTNAYAVQSDNNGVTWVDATGWPVTY